MQTPNVDSPRCHDEVILTLPLDAPAPLTAATCTYLEKRLLQELGGNFVVEQNGNIVPAGGPGAARAVFSAEQIYRALVNIFSDLLPNLEFPAWDETREAVSNAIVTERLRVLGMHPPYRIARFFSQKYSVEYDRVFADTHSIACHEAMNNMHRRNFDALARTLNGWMSAIQHEIAGRIKDQKNEQAALTAELLPAEISFRTNRFEGKDFPCPVECKLNGHKVTICLQDPTSPFSPLIITANLNKYERHVLTIPNGTTVELWYPLEGLFCQYEGNSIHIRILPSSRATIQATPAQLQDMAG